MEKKKVKLFSAIALVTLVLLVVGATYAYFQNQYGAASNADVKVMTYTTDVLTFETGDAINISADQETFAEGKGNQTGSTFARATLQANNKTNTATANYYIYLNITNNEFTYTNTGTPELLLQVIDKNSGNPVTSITGLDYVTVTDGKNTSISGFDITDKTGLLTLLDNKEISASPKTIEEYTITITLVNHSFDQNNNTGKNFNAKLMIQKEKEKETISMVCSNGQNLSDCIKSMNGKDEALYYHDSTLTNGAGDNSYRYAGADYILTETGKNIGGGYLFRRESDDSDSLIDLYCDGAVSFCGVNTKSFYYQIKNDEIQYSSYNAVVDAAILKGLLKSNMINNYICFGSDETTCPVDNLYRIIGVFDGRVKLIKADYATTDLLGTDGAYNTKFKINYHYSIPSYYRGGKSVDSLGSYYWNSKNDFINTWSTSLLNKTNLNTNYLNNIGSKWANMIDTTTWKVGGNTLSNIRNAISSVAYQNEIINPSTSTTYEAKVGLMYASDYGFAADPSTWTINVGTFMGKTDAGEYIMDKNWMYMGLDEWTITPETSGSLNSFSLSGTGGISSVKISLASGPTYNDITVRPTFYLNSSIRYSSGSGTKDDSIRIDM